MQLFRSLWQTGQGKPASYASHFLLMLAVFVLTFPPLYPALFPGLDASYFFAFNHFFAGGTVIGRDIVFTYGPLGFLKYPAAIGHNLEMAVVVLSLLRLLYIASLFHLSALLHKGQWGFAFLISFLILAYFSIDYTFLGFVAVLTMISHIRGRRLFLVAALLLAAIALLIKINIGITCCLLIGGYTLYTCVKGNSVKPLILPVLLFPFFLLLLWMLIYGSLEGIWDYITGIVLISTGNLSATALNTPNNWIILGFCFLSLAAVPFVQKTPLTTLLYWCFALVFFAVFRYSFAREENLHIKSFFDLLLLFTFLLLLLNPGIRKASIVLLVASLSLFYTNMQLSGMYHAEDRMRIMGAAHFREIVLDFKAFKERAVHTSGDNLAPFVLPGPVLEKLKGHTVDCFPWELSYIPANNLSYRPRPLFQVGCTNTPSLDLRNASFIASDKAADFLLWQRKCWSNAVTSIDNRYLFNEDGKTLYELLNHYSIVDSSSSCWVMQRTHTTKLSPVRAGHTSSGNWGEWIECPRQEEILRGRILCRKSWAGKLKSALYKEKEYYIDYRLADGREISHRFVPDNAMHGVWISPYVQELNNRLEGTEVIQVRIRSTDRDYFLENPIAITWESFSVLD
jgi:hypothetical protein